MCGIFCSICINGNIKDFQHVYFVKFNCCLFQITYIYYFQYYNNVKELLKHRGPDAVKELCLEHLGIIFAGHVLWQQGKSYSEQPIYKNEHYLLFNGDIYLERSDLSESDTEWLFDKIVKCQVQRLNLLFKKDSEII